MFEINVHIFTDGDFELTANTYLTYEHEYYTARKFFDTKEQADEYIDNVFSIVNKAYNQYNQQNNLIERLKGLRKDVDYTSATIDPYTDCGIYLAGNQEFEIRIVKHFQTKKEFLEQRIHDISEEYFELYGEYPEIVGKVK